MNRQSSSETLMDRRAVLKQSSMAAAWVTPVVQVVSLPAHAQTSGGGLVNVSIPPPPGPWGCFLMPPTTTLSRVSFQVKNQDTVPIIVTDIMIAVRNGSASIWSLVNPILPFATSPGNLYLMELASNPAYVCGDGGMGVGGISPGFDITLVTGRGNYAMGNIYL